MYVWCVCMYIIYIYIYMCVCVCVCTDAQDAVICPICLRRPLHQQCSIIACACCFALDTQTDGVALADMRRGLDRVVSEHRWGELFIIIFIIAINSIITAIMYVMSL